MIYTPRKLTVERLFCEFAVKATFAQSAYI